MALAKEGHCGMWLRSKGRNCSGAALPGSNYCGNHHWQPSSALRVPCPLDASHTVAANRVEAHVTKCPAAKQLQAVKQCAYYSPGLNAGSDVDDDDDDTDDASYTHSGDAGRRTSVTEDKDKVEELVSKIEAAYTALVRFEDSFVRPAACTEWLSSQTDRRHPFQEKHVVQQASMLGNLEQFGMLGRCDKAVAFIEFGAGRGYLSHMLSDCYAAHKVVLVERRSYKFKADRTLRYSTGVSLSRLRVDIEDLNLDAVEALQDCSSVVGVSKHLCGAATDMALRCCMRRGVAGVGIATCCHHLCGWKAYVGKEVLAGVGIGRAEFEAMARLSSWAVSGPVPDSASDCTVRGRADLGLKCKRVIDMGRVLWLQQQQQQQGGMQAKMVRYVPPQTSPENILILAHMNTS